MGYTKVLFFYSNIWCSGCTNMRPLFFDEVHKYNMRYELIDVDTEEGAELSCKYGIRNVPSLVFTRFDKVISVVKGNDAYKKIKKYANR